jgi:hypothetical protein
MTKQQTGEPKRAKWVGWWRPDDGKHWKPLIYDAKEDRCFRRLLDSAKGGDKVVLLTGRNPNRW